MVHFGLIHRSELLLDHFIVLVAKGKEVVLFLRVSRHLLHGSDQADFYTTANVVSPLASRPSIIASYSRSNIRDPESL